MSDIEREVNHIFESGANEVRVIKLIKNLISKALLSRNQNLETQLAECKKVITGALGIQPLWLPNKCEIGHFGELKALAKMKQDFEELLKGDKTP